MAEPRSVHMQKLPACHLQGIVSGDAWMIYGMLVLECLRVPSCTESLHGTVTMRGSIVIHSYSTQLTPFPHTLYHTYFLLPSQLAH